MNILQKGTLIFASLLLPLMAEEVMKITLTDQVLEESLSTISAIVFTANTMEAGASYNLDNIEKIEFYDDAATSINSSSNSQASAPALSKEHIGFAVTASTLSLTLPTASNLSVSLFSINGRKVADLFNGYANVGALNLNLTRIGVATGIYSVVVKANNAVFVRKLMIK